MPDVCRRARTLSGGGLPTQTTLWYVISMNGTHTVVVGDRGRLVLPAEVRKRAGVSAGTPLVLLESRDGLVLLTREQLRARVRDELDGLDLVSELLSDRRTSAQRDDVE